MRQFGFAMPSEGAARPKCRFAEPPLLELPAREKHGHSGVRMDASDGYVYPMRQFPAANPSSSPLPLGATRVMVWVLLPVYLISSPATPSQNW